MFLFGLIYHIKFEKYQLYDYSQFVPLYKITGIFVESVFIIAFLDSTYFSVSCEKVLNEKIINNRNLNIVIFFIIFHYSFTFFIAVLNPLKSNLNGFSPLPLIENENLTHLLFDK